MNMGRVSSPVKKWSVKSCDDVLIFRLSWVYGDGKQNFIYKLAEWANKNEYLKIACDEFSVPTHTDTIVNVTLKSLDAGMRGLFHLTNSGFCSRYEWATCHCQVSRHKEVYSARFNGPLSSSGETAEILRHDQRTTVWRAQCKHSLLGRSGRIIFTGKKA